MVVYGFLSFGNGTVSLPNKERMNNTREENVKFGEVEVIDSGASVGLPGRGDYTVFYTNGFNNYYPTEGVTGYKSLGVSPTSTDLDDTYLSSTAWRK